MKELVKTRTYDEGTFEVHELAALVPMATEVEQTALTHNIRNNGQREPIIIWQNRIVDGRCRQLALTMLHFPVMYKELDSELTEAEVATYVKSVNTRRNLTITQKAMSGAISKVDKRDTRAIPAIAKSWAVSKALMENAMYIYRQDTTIATALFDGASVDIIDDKGRTTTSSKVSAVYAHLKRLEEVVPKVPTEYGYNVNALIDTQAGKDWFYEQLKIRKQNSLTNDTNICMHIGNLANLMFKKDK